MVLGSLGVVPESPGVDLESPGVDLENPGVDLGVLEVALLDLAVGPESPGVVLASPEVDLGSPEVDLGRPEAAQEGLDLEVVPEIDLSRVLDHVAGADLLKAGMYYLNLIIHFSCIQKIPHYFVPR